MKINDGKCGMLYVERIVLNIIRPCTRKASTVMVFVLLGGRRFLAPKALAQSRNFRKVTMVGCKMRIGDEQPRLRSI